MWDFNMLFIKCIAAIAVATSLVVVFYMPQELRQDLRSPDVSKKYKREMRSKLRWQKSMVGWRMLCALLLVAVAIFIIYSLMSILA